MPHLPVRRVKGCPLINGKSIQKSRLARSRLLLNMREMGNHSKPSQPIREINRRAANTNTQLIYSIR